MRAFDFGVRELPNKTNLVTVVEMAIDAGSSAKDAKCDLSMILPPLPC